MLAKVHPCTYAYHADDTPKFAKPSVSTFKTHAECPHVPVGGGNNIFILKVRNITTIFKLAEMTHVFLRFNATHHAPLKVKIWGPRGQLAAVVI